MNGPDAKFEVLASQSLIGIAIIEDGKFSYSNAKFDSIFGYSADEMRTLAPIDLSVPRYRKEFAAVLGKHESGTTQEVERVAHGLRKNGDEVDIEVHSSAVRVGDERALITMVLDVTQRTRAEQDVLALQQKLRDESTHDPLTGLYNRRYLELALARELILAERQGSSIGVIMGDLDHFKTVNDRFGHLAGDEVLRVFGALMKRHARGSDIYCRYGGEEFVLILPGMAKDAAVARAEEVRQALAAEAISVATSKIAVTASFGVATFPRDGKNGDELIAAADRAMYAAKTTGRNRVTVSSGLLGQDPEWTSLPDAAVPGHRTLPSAYERLKTAMEGADTGAWEADLHTYTMVWDDTLRRQFGVADGDPDPDFQNWLMRIHADDRAGVLAKVEACVKLETRQFDAEFRVPIAEGKVRWFRSFGRVFSGRDGVALQASGINIDITDVKEAQAEQDRIGRELALFRALIDKSSDSIQVLDPQTMRFLDMNERACADLGYSREELLSMHAADIDSVFAKAPDVAVSHALGSSSSALFEGVHRRKDGSTFPVEIAISRVVLDRPYDIAVVRDITARKASEAELQLANLVVEQSPSVLFRWSALAGGAIVYVSENVRQWGYESLSLVAGKRPFIELVHTDDRKGVTDEAASRLASGIQQFALEFRVVSKAGVAIWVDARIHVEHDSCGAPLFLQGVLTDITDIRAVQAEKDRIGRELALYRSLIDKSTDSIQILDPETLRFLDMNEQTCTELGYSREELLSMRAHDIDPALAKGRRSTVSPDLGIYGVARIETVHRRKDGSTFPVELTISRVALDRPYLITVSRDITERNRIRQTMQESELRFRSLIETSSDLIGIARSDGIVTYVSPAVREISGYEPKDVVGHSYLDLIAPDDLAAARATLASLVLHPDVPVRDERRVLHKDGSIRQVDSVARNLLDRPGIDGLIVSMRDVTARRTVEAELRLANLVVEQSQSILFRWSALGIVYVSKNVRQWGYESLTLVASKRLMTDLFHADDLQRVTDEMASHVAAGDLRFAIESRIVTKAGLAVWVDARISVERDSSGAPLFFQGVLTDITDIKAAQVEKDRTGRQLALFRTLIDQTSDSIQAVDPQTLRFLDMNERTCTDLGYSRGELLTMGAADIDPVIEQTYRGAPEHELNTSGSTRFESIHRRKDGSTFPVEITVTRVVLDRPYQITVSRDITERNRMKQEMQESELRFRSLIETTSDIVAIARADGTIVYVSPAVREVTGYEPQNLVGRSYFELLLPEDVAAARANLSSLVLHPETPVRDERRIRRKDGSIRYVESVGRNLIDRPGIDGVVVSMRDITARKATEARLQLADLVVEQSPSVLFRWSAIERGPVVYVSENVRQWGYDSRSLVADKQSFADIVYADDLQRIIDEVASQVAGGAISFAIECRILSKAGAAIWVEARVSVERDAAGAPLFFQGVVTDITDRKSQERALARVNRALKALGAGTSAVVHAQAERPMLQQMCEAVVDVAGYRMAWVGFVEHDEARRIRGVAQAGPASDYVDSANIRWSDGPGGQGPAGRCVRTGVAQVAHDIASDPTMLPWRDEAARYGYRSALALPLSDPSGVIGTLTIYAGDLDAFGAEEMTLLSQMAGELSYGLGALRTRVANEENLGRVEHAMESTVRTLATMAEVRDPYTAGHQRRVAGLACEIGTLMGLGEDRLRGLRVGASIHDIGKITVPAEILAKSGPLSAAEFALIKEHPEAGAGILAGVEFPWPVAEMVRQHHERMDGTGYPRGLKGEQILLEARIIAVADVVEAMISHRPYRPGKGIDAALAEIAKGRGVTFDADVVDACIKLFRERGYRIPD